MIPLHRIAINTLIQGLGKVLSTFLGLIAIGMITRYLGTEGFGYYATASNFVQLFAIFIDMGLSLVLVQIIATANGNEHQYIRNLFTLRFFSALVFLSLAPLIGLFFPYTFETKVGIALASLAFFSVTLTQVLVGIFQKNLRMDKVMIAENLGRLCLLASLWYVMSHAWGLWGVLGAVVFSNVVTFFTTLSFAASFTRLGFAFDFPIWKEIWYKTWPIAISIVFNLIYMKSDILILSLTHAPSDVGLYGAAYRVVEVLTTIPVMFMGLILPILSAQFAQKDMLGFQKTLTQAFSFLSLCAFPLFFGTLLFGDRIMALIAGDSFALSGIPLRILILNVTAIFLGNTFAHAVVAIGKQKQMIVAYARTAGIALLFYLALIPTFSYIGAAIGSASAEIMMAISAFWMVKKTTQIYIDTQVAQKAFFASLSMFCVLFFTYPLPILFNIVLGILCYIFFLFYFQAITWKFLQETLILPFLTKRKT